MDGCPLIGENVTIIGQGVIGLLVTHLLSKFPLSELVTLEPYSMRRKFSGKLGADEVLDPKETKKSFEKEIPLKQGSDLTYEVSGNPSTLELAIELTRFNGKIIIGSWYGNKKNSLNLGSEFHRNRIKISSSQVSTINPNYRGRWDRNRRINLCWKMIKNSNFEQLVTHEIPIEKGEEAYELIDKKQEKVLQVLLKYE